VFDTPFLERRNWINLFIQMAMAAASSCVFSSLSITSNDRLTACSRRLDPATKRKGAAPVDIVCLVSSSTHAGTRSSSLAARFCGVPLFSSTHKKNTNSFLVRSVTVASPQASEWEEDEEEDIENSGSSENLKIFVGNLPWSVDSAELAELFKDTGEVTMVEVIYDRQTGRSRGFAFVTMATPADADEAVEKFNGYEYQGRALRVNSGPPPPKDSFAPRGGFRNERPSGNFNSSNRVFVGNLPWGADELSLEQLFSDHGKVVEAKVVYDRETGRSRGFGFVTLSSPQEIEEAISSLDGSDMDGRQIKVNLAETKPARF